MNYAERFEITGKGEEDLFLLHPPRQPKKEIGDYVESQGILVPKRFANLEEALASGKPFIIRSEHPQDYAGASGLLQSAVVNGPPMLGKPLNERIAAKVNSASQREIEEEITRYRQENIDEYSRLLKLPPGEFESKLTYSYWEYVVGTKQTIVADSSIENRYHFFTQLPEGEKLEDHSYSYAVVENGQVVTSGPDKIHDVSLLYAAEAIQFYEEVRKLGAFQKNHAPAVETTVQGDKRYFLQYHRIRNFQPVDFKLERALEDGEIEAGFVRGHTPEEGWVCSTRLYQRDEPELATIDASFDLASTNKIFNELMTQRQKVQFATKQDWDHFTHHQGGEHLAVSQLFKSPVFVFLERVKLKALFPELSDLQEQEPNEREPFRAHLKVISDGRRAIVKRVG